MRWELQRGARTQIASGRNLNLLPFLSLVIVGTVGALAAPPPDTPDVAAAHQLKFQAGVVDTRGLPDVRAAERPSFDARLHYVIQLDGPITPERRAALEQIGVVLGDYVPENAYLAKLRHVIPAQLRALEFVQWIGPLDKRWKLDPALAARQAAPPAAPDAAESMPQQVVVDLFPDADLSAAVTDIVQRGGMVLTASPVGAQWVVDAVLPPSGAVELAGNPEVQFVQVAPVGTLRNDTNRWIVQSNTLNSTPLWAQGLHGEGEIAGLIDGTVNESHCMFDDSVPIGPTHRKLIAMRNAGSSDSHGTHVAGTLAGDASSYGAYTTNDGVAYAAKISASNVNPVFSNPSTLYARFSDAYVDGACVHSNSWGDDGTTAYTTWCRQIDLFSYDYEDNLVAFAVTNLSSLKTPENAKNVLAVGATQDTPNQGSHCSGGTGPTSDGRRKPEVYAPGCSTNSANYLTACSTSAKTGTSMACPAVAGGAILTRQYYRSGFYPTGAADPNDGFIPSGALLKATLINSAVDMTGVAGYPSNSEGWGRLLLDNALYFAGDTRKLYVEDVRNASGLSTGQFATYTINVESRTVPTRITLVWTEPPAAVNAGNPVVNNLDLEVAGPGSVLYRGNVFANGESAPGGVADAKNNVEQVHLLAPASGAYTITVRGTAVNQGTQGYALVVTGALATCTAPEITAQPAGETRGVGAAVTFSVAASGSAVLSYQWRKDGADIDGALTADYTIDPVTQLDAGAYDCVVTNACGSATSDPGVLSVTLPPMCLGDANCDGVISWRDIDYFVSGLNDAMPTWAAMFAQPGPTCPFGNLDANVDGSVSWRDIDPFIGLLNTVCP